MRSAAQAACFGSGESMSSFGRIQARSLSNSLLSLDVVDDLRCSWVDERVVDVVCDARRTAACASDVGVCACSHSDGCLLEVGRHEGQGAKNVLSRICCSVLGVDGVSQTWYFSG